MVRTLAAGACMLALVGCASSISLRPASPDFGADSQAANLSVHLGLLFAEHSLAFAKLTLAAAAGRHDEFRAEAALLAANGGDISDALTAALGPAAGTGLGAAWAEGDNARVDYVVAAVTHDQAKTAAARSSLDNSVGALASPLASALPPPSDSITAKAQADATDFRAVVDDTVAGTYEIAMSDVLKGAGDAAAFGQLIAGRIVERFPDRFPGDPNAKAVVLRAGAAATLEAEAYLLSALTNATVASAHDEATAAMDAAVHTQTSLTNTITALFGDRSGAHLQSMWGMLNPALVAYAKAGDPNSRAAALATGLAPTDTYGPDFTGPVAALLQVVDDQRTPSLDKLPSDDRASAAQFAAVADGITDAAIRLAPGKLS
jgi:hypothetical protein